LHAICCKIENNQSNVQRSVPQEAVADVAGSKVRSAAT